MIRQEMVGKILLRTGVVDAAGLERAHALLAGEGGSLGRIEVEPETATLLPADFSRKHLVAPLNIRTRSLRLAMVDPLDLATIEDVQFLTSKRVTPVVASESAILTLLDREQRTASETRKRFDLLTAGRPLGEVESAADAEYEVADPARLARDTKLPPIVRLVNLILSEAAKAGASDIHIERRENLLQVRHRVDGILHDILTIPRDLQDSTISRIKVISGMGIAERLRSGGLVTRLEDEFDRVRELLQAEACSLSRHLSPGSPPMYDASLGERGSRGGYGQPV